MEARQVFTLTCSVAHLAGLHADGAAGAGQRGGLEQHRCHPHAGRQVSVIPVCPQRVVAALDLVNAQQLELFRTARQAPHRESCSFADKCLYHDLMCKRNCDRYAPALSALTEAVKYRRDSWQTWSNYAAAAVQAGAPMQALRGAQQVSGRPSSCQLPSQLRNQRKGEEGSWAGCLTSFLRMARTACWTGMIARVTCMGRVAIWSRSGPCCCNHGHLVWLRGCAFQTCQAAQQQAGS